MQGIPKIPYFQTSRYRVATMVELAGVKPGDMGADLGSGDGRIVIAFAKAGVEMHGYEIDPVLRKTAEKNIRKEFVSCHPEQREGSSQKQEDSPQGHLLQGSGASPSLQNDNKFVFPTIHNKDFWTENLSKYSIICCYPMPTIMGRLEKKLKEELKPGARVLLNYFPFLHWKEKKIKDNIYLYVR